MTVQLLPLSSTASSTVPYVLLLGALPSERPTQVSISESASHGSQPATLSPLTSSISSPLSENPKPVSVL